MRQGRVDRPPHVDEGNIRRWLDRVYDAINALPSDSSDVFITSDYTPLAGRLFIFADASSSTITVHLPSSATDEGSMFWIKKTDSSANAVVLGGLVDGSSNPSIVTEGYVMNIRRFGGSYYRIGN